MSDVGRILGFDMEPEKDEDTEVLHIDGSQGEGGGQVLRLASSLAAITGQAIRVSNIRAGRARPGLAAQHLKGLQLLARMCGGTLSSATGPVAVGSCDILLRPGAPISASEVVADARGAGSTALLAQSALPCALFAAAGDDSVATLTLRGGTDAAFAPPVDYISDVLLPTLEPHLGRAIRGEGQTVSLELLRRGFFPRGGGTIELTVLPLPQGGELSAFQLTERGRLKSVRVKLYTSVKDQQKREVVLDQLRQGAWSSFRSHRGSQQTKHIGVVPEFSESYAPASDPGFGIGIVAETHTGVRLGANGLSCIRTHVQPYELGAAVATEMVDLLASGSCVDEWLQDQLVIFMALAKGHSKMTCREPTLHTRTTMQVIPQLLPAVRFTLEALQDSPDGQPLYRLESQGCGRKA